MHFDKLYSNIPLVFMVKRKTINFCRILFDDKDLDNIWKVFNSHFNIEDCGFVFSNLVNEENIFSGTVIKRSVSNISEYNQITFQFEKRSIFIFTTIEFGFDFERNVLYAFGQANNLNIIKSIIRQLFSNYSVSELNYDLMILLQRIKAVNAAFEIEEISINKYSSEAGISGKYIAKVSNSNKGIDLIKRYNTDVYRAVINLEPKDIDAFRLIVSNSGQLSIIGDEDYFDDNFNFLKKNLI